MDYGLCKMYGLHLAWPITYYILCFGTMVKSYQHQFSNTLPKAFPHPKWWNLTTLCKLWMICSNIHQYIYTPFQHLLKTAVCVYPWTQPLCPRTFIQTKAMFLLPISWAGDWVAGLASVAVIGLDSCQSYAVFYFILFYLFSDEEMSS